MKVLEFNAKSFLERIVLRVTKNFTRDANWLSSEFLPQFTDESKTNFHKYLALFQDEFDSEIEDDLNILEVLVLQYLPESNCGFVSFLHPKFDEKKEENDLKYDWGRSLIKEAEIVFNKEAEKNGFQKVREIFYHVSADFNSTTGCHLGCLYDMGFRLVQTEHLWRKSMQKNCHHLLVYRPFLIPDFQVENGTLPGQIKTDIIEKFLMELLTSTGHIKNGFDASDVEELQALIGKLEDTASEVFVKSSFPWHGRAEPCPGNQVAIVGGGMAGLAAAASLSEAGFDVVLLEAANYLGGRVKQVQPFKGFAPVDLGGEFIHGSDSIINRIAKENGWLVQPCYRCEEVKSEDIFYYKGELHPLLSDHPDIQKAWKVWDELIFLWEKKNKENILQNPGNSDETKNEDMVLSKDGGEAKVVEESSISVSYFADTVEKLVKSQETERKEDIRCDDLSDDLQWKFASLPPPFLKNTQAQNTTT